MRALALALSIATVASAAGAGPAADPSRRPVRFAQRLGAELPRDAAFRDQGGFPVTLGSLLEVRPLVLALVDFECRGICPMLEEGLASTLRAMSLEPGRDYDVVLVSFVPALPDAGLESARPHDLPGAPGETHPWRRLRGDAKSVARLASAVGFEAEQDPETGRFSHPAGILVVTPGGVVSRYLFGIDFAPRDLRLAIVEASQGRVGTLTDRALLLCFRYDPASGRYGFAAMAALRVLGATTVVLLLTLVIRLRRQEAHAYYSR